MNTLFDCHCNQRVKHKGKMYLAGDSIQLTQDDIDVVGDAVEKIGPAEVQPEETATAADEQAEQLNQLTLAIAKLDKEDPEAWTGKGKPQVDALQALVDFDITAKMRDAAWELFNAAPGDE